MEIGGSQLNAVELAGAVRDLGHEVTVVSEPGPLTATVQNLGLEHIEIPMHRRRPSVPVMRLLSELVDSRGFDVVHGHEWPPAIEAFFGPRRRSGCAAVATVMSAAVAPFIPYAMPLVVGTEELAKTVRHQGYQDVTLIEPPVDVRANSPEYDAGDFRSRYGLDPDAVLVVVVCRLVRELKIEGLLTACDGVAGLAARGHAVQLAIVGDGAERSALEQRATQANARVGRRVITLIGELADPRPAYAAADVMLGMGGSALRGMAFGKPLVVQGERAFWQLCTPQTAPTFLSGGWYGLGDGRDGAAALQRELEPLLTAPQRRSELGVWTRRLVVDRFSLEAASGTQVEVYRRAVEATRRATPRDTLRTAALLGAYKIHRRFERLRAKQSADDFNSLKKMKKPSTTSTS
jgi:phosphatidyl-myo-inositol alpha-mannosyltransferase